MKVEYGGYWAWKYKAGAIANMFNIVLTILRNMRAEGIKFDCVVVHGTSGTWLAPLLIQYGYRVVMVRKKNENSHGMIVEMAEGVEHNKGVIIDDLIASGATIQRILTVLTDFQLVHNCGSFEVTGVALYNQKHHQGDVIEGLPVFGYTEDMIQWVTE